MERIQEPNKSKIAKERKEEKWK